MKQGSLKNNFQAAFHKETNMEANPIPSNPTATLLLQLLNDGWQIHLQDENYLGYTASHAERITEAQQAAEALCLQLAYFNQEPRCHIEYIPANEIAHLHQTVLPMVQQQLTQHLLALSPDNPWLFDLKGNPICAVPDCESGEDIISTVKQYGMDWQLLNRLECQKPTHFHVYMCINRMLSNKQIGDLKVAVIFIICMNRIALLIK